MRFSTLSICMILVATACADKHPLIGPGEGVKMLAEEFVFTEGPACDTVGNVFFSDVRDSKTYLWSLAGKLSVFHENRGETNELSIDHQGNLVCLRSGRPSVTKVSPHGTATTIVDRFEQKRFNSPNDCTVSN